MKLALALIVPLGLYGQMQDNRGKEMTCNDQGYNRQSHHCEIREQILTSTGRLTADPGVNGGVSIKGWLRSDVLVRSRIDSWGNSDADAASLASQIRIDAGGGAIAAHGPSGLGNRGWSVSYEIFVPRVTAVEAKASNGGLHVSDVEGTIRLETSNGGIHLARIAGDVTGITTNGGIHAELMGNFWQGRQLDLSTTNGGIHVEMPAGYSAHLQAQTINGSVHSEFPVTVTGHIRPQNLDTNLGSGGALIHFKTTNGGIHLSRM